MGSRGALVTACLLVCAGSSSCVLGNDSDPPVLAVDPVWDASSTDSFLPSTCSGAGVGSMTWAIKDAKGKTLKEVEKPEKCEPLDFVGLSRGTYQVQLAGYDKDGVKRWESTCTDLELGRFDVLYECPVDQLPEDETDPGDDVDAGPPDAGE